MKRFWVGSLIALIAIFALSSFSPPSIAQELPEGKARLIIRTVDCSAADPTDPSTCDPLPNVGLVVAYDGIGGTSANEDLTNEVGEIVLDSLDAPARETVTYIDDGRFAVVPLVAIQFIDLEPGDIGELIFVFVAPVAPPENRARLVVSAVDCSGEDADPDDPSTCGTLSSVPFLVEYDGIGGTSSNVDDTNLDGVIDIQFQAPATETITFLDDETNLDLVPLDAVQSVSLEPGELGELLFVFVDPVDDGEPVTELPNTGSGGAMAGTATRAGVAVVAAIGVLLASIGTGRRRLGSGRR